MKEETMNKEDNRDLSFLPIANDSPKFLTIQEIEKYNSEGYITSLNAFSAEAAAITR